MNSWAQRVVLVVVAVGCGMQLIPVHRDNPPTDRSKSLYATHPTPTEIQALFERSCRDCHSNETIWPWYSHLAPVSWLVANDVHDGRKHFNLSEWGNYPEEKKLRKLGEICEEVKNEDMPDDKYALIHRSARLDKQQRAMLCDWVETTRKPLQTEVMKLAKPSERPDRNIPASEQ
jgi:hypothetical protein